ncbi:MAG: hypothetical protein QXD03_05500 [Candidatus Anstonellales archaeon]
MNRKIGLIVVLTLMVFSGCIKDTDKLRNYNIKKAVYDRVNNKVDFELYEGAILAIANGASSKEEVEEYRNKYSNVVDSVLFDRLIVNKDENVMDSKDVKMEEFNNDDGGSEVDIDNGGNKTGDLYPIYDEFGNIVEYGTKEQSEASLKMYQSKPDNEIKSYSICGNYIMTRIVNKYLGEYMLVVRICNGKIVDYEYYR